MVEREREREHLQNERERRSWLPRGMRDDSVIFV